jgi:hypothetical protein
MTPSEIKPATFRLVAQCLNQLRHQQRAPNRNRVPVIFYRGKGGQCVGLTTLPPSCADCIEIWELYPSGTLRACNKRVQELLYHYLSKFLISFMGYLRVCGVLRTQAYKLYLHWIIYDGHQAQSLILTCLSTAEFQC